MQELMTPKAVADPANDLYALELGMQELEAMEAPGWWTAIGVSVGAGVSYLTVYSVLSGAALT